MTGPGRGRGHGGIQKFPQIDDDTDDSSSSIQSNSVRGRGRGRGRPAPTPVPVAIFETSQGIVKRMESLRAPPDADYHSVLHIPQFRKHHCNVPYSHIYTTGTADTSSSSPLPRDDEVYPWTGERSGWLTEAGSDHFVRNVIRYCLLVIRRPDYSVYDVDRLPNPNHIEPGKNAGGKVHVIRCSSASDFHVIFTEKQSWFDLNACDPKWTHFFRKRIHPVPDRWDNKTFVEIEEDVKEHFCFHTPYEVFHGLCHILTEYVKVLKSPPFKRQLEIVKGASGLNYFAGDLVIVMKREDDVDVAYRAVLLEPAKVITDLDSDPVDSFVVYLLETGEKRVVKKSKLIALPRPFVGFQPLAMPCSLSSKKDSPADIREIFRSRPGGFFARVCSRELHAPPIDITHSRTLLLLDKYAYSIWLSLELIDEDRVSGEDFTRMPSPMPIQSAAAAPALAEEDQLKSIAKVEEDPEKMRSVTFAELEAMWNLLRNRD